MKKISVQGLKNLTILPFILATGAQVSGQIKENALNIYFTKLAETGQFNGNVLVAENGRIIYEKSFGYADFSKKTLNNRSTSFPVASITKTLTSTAILQLEEKGKLRLSDPYIQFFPNFPYPSITIHQLLSHTSRIPSPEFYSYLDSLRKTKDTFFTNADVIPALIAMNKPLVAMPKREDGRSTFTYSNLNYYLLALLIERTSGMPYGSYLKKYIFLPAGMESSSLSEFYFGMDKNLCTEHRYRYLFAGVPERIDTTSENTYIFTTYNFKGHGDVVSTARDLLKYDRALTNGILLKPSSLAKAFEVVVPGNSNMSGYGLGWSILPDSTKGRVVFHHGGGLGIEAMFVRNLDKDQTIVLLDNTKQYTFNKAVNALNMLNGVYVPVPKKSLAKYFGKSIDKEGIAVARTRFKNMQKDTANFYLSEDEMNVLGYQFLWNNKNEQSHEVLKINVELFPNNWNSYDSYGEILLKMGRKEEAIQMYRRSIELNPDNEGGKKILEQLNTGK